MAPMQPSPAIQASRNFLGLLQQTPPPQEGELARALDELAMAYHLTPEGEPSGASGNPEARRDGHKVRCDELRGCLSDFDYYAVGDWLDPTSSKSVIADPIDDLVDIERDLEEVLWRFDNQGPDDAHWHFRFGYEAHWGRHLRHLAAYLYERLARAGSDS